MVIQGKVAADGFIELLRRLRKRTKRPIFLIADGHPVHKSKKVEKFVEGLGGMLELFTLTAYSPERNPAELV